MDEAAKRRNFYLILLPSFIISDGLYPIYPSLYVVTEMLSTSGGDERRRAST
jgi:hypothetical protein